MSEEIEEVKEKWIGMEAMTQLLLSLGSDIKIPINSARHIQYRDMLSDLNEKGLLSDEDQDRLLKNSEMKVLKKEDFEKYVNCLQNLLESWEDE